MFGEPQVFSTDLIPPVTTAVSRQLLVRRRDL